MGSEEEREETIKSQNSLSGADSGGKQQNRYFWLVYMVITVVQKHSPEFVTTNYNTICKENLL